jgi:hypothetical protein
VVLHLFVQGNPPDHRFVYLDQYPGETLRPSAFGLGVFLLFEAELRSFGAIFVRASKRHLFGRSCTMIEVTCQTCGRKAQVASFLAAARQACGHCHELLMGPLERGTRITRPANFDAAPLPPAPSSLVRGNPLGKWLGLLVGMLVGIVFVVVVGNAERGISLAQRGAIVGALSGVLLAPFIAMFLFLAMLLMPWALDGMLGDSVWTRIARSINERRWRPLLLPIFVCLVLPMALCGFGGSRMTTFNSSTLVSAGLGAMVVGGIVGFLCGGSVAKARARAARATSGFQVQVSVSPGRPVS